MGVLNLSTWAEIAFANALKCVNFVANLVQNARLLGQKMVGFGKGLDCLFDQNRAKTT